MSRAKVEVYQGLVKAAVDSTVAAAEKVAEGDRLRQTGEGKAHPLWLLGHLTQTLSLFAVEWISCGDSFLPKGYGKAFMAAFAGGVPITGNADDYPAWDEVLENYKKVGEKAVAALDGLQDSELPEPLKGPCPDEFRKTFDSNEKTLTIAVVHDAHHRGQIALLANLGA